MLSAETLLAQVKEGDTQLWATEHSSSLPKDPRERLLKRPRSLPRTLQAMEARSELLVEFGPAETVYADKAPAGFRPIKTLDVAQRTTFASLVTQALPEYTTAADEFESYYEFETAPLESNRSFVVLADVSHYYDYIPHHLLRRELVLHGAPIRVADRLMVFLKTVMGGSVGIPQTYPSAHILGDLFLSHVQRQLGRHGFEVWRYTDDFRIGASDFGRATEAISQLNMSLRSLGLALNDRKTLRYSRERYQERAERRDEAWSWIVELTGELGEWATESSMYDEYDESVAAEWGEAEESIVDESRRVIDVFDEACQRRGDDPSGPAASSGEQYIGLLARAFGHLASAEAELRLNLAGWFRHVPTLIPSVLRALGHSNPDARTSMSSELATEIAEGRLHLSDWQEIWLSWGFRNDMSEHTALQEHEANVGASAQSSYARAHALRALIGARPDDADLAAAVGREFSHGSSAAREVLAHALAQRPLPRALRGIRDSVRSEDVLYGIMAQPATAKRAATVRVDRSDD